ncbi:hypothetical protein FQN54_001847 [Arachnomyces sp. PD_36]|nr:hypothetical protein FQN54_001847 [Arachnomyces sp. PD_36]
MGSASSKPAKAAANASLRRQYPKQPSPSAISKGSPGATEAKSAAPSSEQRGFRAKDHQASSKKTEFIDLDAHDPHFAASLRSIGPVTPSPTLSNSSTFNPRSNQPSENAESHPRSVFPTSSQNPALLVISARSRITKAAEKEAESFGKRSHAGREFLDPTTIQQVISMRDRQGLGDREIERHFRLKEGVVARLGRKGIVGEV